MKVSYRRIENGPIEVEFEGNDIDGMFDIGANQFSGSIAIEGKLYLLSGGVYPTAPLLVGESLDPHSDNYVGHIRAIASGLAKCLCKEGERDIMCPFHGR